MRRRPRRQLSLSATTAGVLALFLTSGLRAHQDDPKARDNEPAYTGPGYRAGAAGPGSSGEDTIFPHLGMELLSWVPISEFEGSHAGVNDCWGYVSPSGREYAILGLHAGNGFVEITNPALAQVIETIGGPDSLWGDIKVYGHHVYAVTEAPAVGIQVIDVSQIDFGIVTLVNEIDLGSHGKSHNIVIDEASGYLYRVGGSFYGFGVYDLNVDAVNPPLVASWGLRYVHDAQVVTYTEGEYAGRQIAFLCGGDNSGWVDTGLEILDVTNKSNIFQLSRFQYPNGVYSHQAWLSEDRQHVYLNDELDEGDLGVPTNTKVINVADLENPYELTNFTNGNSAIGHNLYVRGSLVFEANYTSGLRVFDATNPAAPVEVAYFDTYPDHDDTNYSGMWSTYPFFPSGTVIASDRQRGLFVLRMEGAEPVYADIDGDGIVGFTDLVQLLSEWGDCPAPPQECPSDIDLNGNVGFPDLLELLANWS